MKRLKRILALLAIAVLAFAPVQGAEEKKDKKPLIWDKDNPKVQKKLVHPEAPEGVTGDWLIVSLSSEPEHLEPYTSSGVYSQRIYSYIFNSLLDQDGWTLKYETGKDTNSLASNYHIQDLIILKEDKKKLFGTYTRKGPNYMLKTEEGTLKIAQKKVLRAQKSVVYTFKLREDARWHDGEELTAHDVAFSFDVIKNEGVKPVSLRNYFNDLDEVEILGKYKVRFIFSKPYWYAFRILVGTPIVPMHPFNLDKYGKDPRKVAQSNKRFAKDYNGHDFRRSPMGSGPYKFEKWDSGKQIVLQRNEKYWGKKAYVDKIVWKYTPNPIAALQAFKSGEVDFIPNLPSEIFIRDTKGEKFESEFVKSLYYTPGYSYLGWNMRRPIFKDRRVRLALTHLMPRETILKKLLYGMGKIVTGPFYYFGPVYDHRIKAWDFDPKKAGKLLYKAGWADRDSNGIIDKNGKDFEFDLLFVADSPFYKQMAEIYQEELRKAGIKVNLVRLKWQALLHKVKKNNFDAVFLGWGSSVEGDPFQVWHSSQTDEGESNHVGYENRRVDRYMEKARKILHDQRRRRLYRRMHRVLHYDQPYTFMYVTPKKSVYHSRFRGVRWLKPRPGWDLTEWYVPKELQKYGKK